MELREGRITKKVCMVGDFAIGKTSLVNRFVYNFFSERYKSTLGVNISQKDVLLPDLPAIRLLIWDLEGADVFGGVRENYLLGAAGALLACDLTRNDSIQHLGHYAEKLHQLSPQASIVVIGNKADLLEPSNPAFIEIQAVARNLEAPFQITSAKTGEGVEAVFHQLVESFFDHNHG